MITPPAITAPAPPSASLDTGNWAGYLWNGGSKADAAFTVPTTTLDRGLVNGDPAGLAIWDGLGQVGNSHIAQIGIYDYDDSGHIGWAGFCAWWPDTDQSCGAGISSGDRIFIRVVRNGLSYTMQMHDAGPHNVWSVTVQNHAFPALSQGQGIAENTPPGESVGNFSDIPFGISGDPSEEVYSSNVGYAVKNSGHSFTIHH